MWARRIIQAIVWNAEPLDRLTVDDMRIDNFVHVSGFLHGIPHGLGIHDHGWAVLALIQASSLVGANRIFDSPLREFGFECSVQVARLLRIAATARMVSRTGVGADKKMMFEFWHR
jgi:hypothetical protein